MMNSLSDALFSTYFYANKILDMCKKKMNLLNLEKVNFILFFKEIPTQTLILQFL